MKKIFLLLLLFTQRSHAERAIGDAKISFQTSVNNYQKNPTAENAQVVVDEYDSTENTDKYRRTFVSYLTARNLTIDQIRQKASAPMLKTKPTPAQALNAQEKETAAPVVKTKTALIDQPVPPTALPTVPEPAPVLNTQEQKTAVPVIKTEPVPALSTQEKETLLDIQELERFAQARNLTQDPQAQTIINNFKADPKNFRKAKAQLQQMSIEKKATADTAG